MNTNFSIHPESLIGDTILPEPALFALGEKTGQNISLSGVHPDHAFLYENHPYIRLTDIPGKNLDPWTAMQWGHQHNCSMYYGFFHQVGLREYKEYRAHYQSFNIPYIPRYENGIAIIPWARSCAGHHNLKANLMNHDLSWWSRLAEKCPIPIVSFGGGYVPYIDKVENVRKTNLRTSVYLIIQAKIVVTVQTGLCHVMEGYRTKNTIFLAPRDSWMVTRNPGNAPYYQAPILSREKDGKIYWDENEVLETIQEMLK
jgi:hypothetical protein